MGLGAIEMATTPMTCPLCGSAGRTMTRQEWRDHNGGRDAGVVAMPRICPKCGHVWDAPLSRRTCYLIAALAGGACIICAIALVASIAALVWALFIREGPAGGQRLSPVFTVLGASLIGSVTTAMACRKYLRLARESSPSRS
jgi:hypothetical protein